MFVKDWMTPDPVTISGDASLADAHALFNEHTFRHLPVVGGEGVLLGIVTLADLMSATLGVVEGAADQAAVRDGLGAASVKDYMNRQPIAVDVDETLETAALLMREYKIGALPVLNEGNLVGVLTETDVFSVLIDALGLQAGGARMVIDLPEGGSNKAALETLERLTEKGLEIASIATYHPRHEHGKARMVVRAVGEGETAKF